MKNKTCGECKYFNPLSCVCIKFGQKTSKSNSICFCFPTNGDRVRQMSNRELAELLDEVNCFYCPYENKKNGLCNRPDEKNCIDGIEEWLNAPAGKDNNVPTNAPATAGKGGDDEL